MKNIIIAIVVGLVIFFYFIFLAFTPVGVIQNDSYAVTDNKIAENLFKENIAKEDYIVEPIKVYATDSLYSGQGKMFVGDNKKVSIDPTYPLFTNDNLALVNLSSDTTLIDSEFNDYIGYPNFTLTDGKLYNKDDQTQADTNEYLFLKLSNMLFLNSEIIDIKTAVKEFKININSIINFNEENIKYYSFVNNLLVYNKIEDIDMKSNITINNNSFTYEQLLVYLKIIEAPTIQIPDVDVSNDITEDTPSVPYQKPTVNCTEFIPNVYSARSSLSILDPAGVITSPIIFEVKNNDKVYLRKAFLSSGTLEIVGLSPSTAFEIRGYFTYQNDKGKLIEQTIIEQTITTKGIEDLSPITLSFNNGEVYSSKIEIKNLKITDGFNSETIKGIKKVTVKINGDSYKISGNDLNALLNGKEITYSSPENLKSNTITEYEITMSDIYGNDAVVINNKGVTRTSRKIPKVTIKVEQNDISKVSLRATLENKDNVSLQNYHYIVSTSDNKIISQGLVPDNDLIDLSSLDSNALFQISVYGNYDIDDGKGTQENQLLGETKFTSIPITSLGYVRLNIELKDLLQSTVALNINIDTASTNNKLIELLQKLKLNIIKKDENNEIVVFSKEISGNDLELLKSGQSLLEAVTGLRSSTEYYIKIESIVTQGDREYNLDTLINTKSFKTLREDAKVIIRNSFTTENLIDFDVKVDDIDFAILSNNVRLEVRDADGKIVRIEKIKINDDFIRLTYDKLIANAYYTFNYIAEEYNVGHDNSTFVNNQVIESYRVYTEVGINGTIDIVSLLEKQTGKNLFDINNLIRWKSNGVGTDEKTIDNNNGTITLTALNGYHNYSYYLIDYASKKLTVSFYAKLVDGTAPVYIANSDGDSTTYLLADLNNTYKKYTYTFTLNTNGYIGFNIREISGKNLRTTIMIKDLQIEEGTTATSYQAFMSSSTYDAQMSINLNDTRDEISTNDYYVNVYREDNLVNTYQYDIDGTNKVINKINTYALDKKSTYRLDLTVRIRDREYVIASISFTTEKEIRGIKTVAEFFRMHNNGRYIITSDLDFRNNGNAYGATFYGEIDFQGHKVIMAAQNGASYLFNTIGSTGLIKNIDFHIYLNNIVERSYYYGLNYYNYGTIENLMVTIESATTVPNIYYSTTSYVNYGTITNFVVNAKASVSGERCISDFVQHNYGIIENGYVYGAPINATFTNLTTSVKRAAAVAAYTGNNSAIKNVFSLISVNSSDSGTNNKQIGLLVGENNRSLIQNVYTVGQINIDNTSGDPNVGYVSSIINPINLFYASSKIYNSNYSQKVSSLAIRDSQFQSKVLNSANMFTIDGLVDNGYYPQIIWPDCMPYQELIPLMEVENSDLIDITSTEVLESNIDSAEIMFNIHNPAAERITNIALKDASIRIISQENSKGKTKLIGMVESPIKYLSKYFVKSITSVGTFNIAYTRTYADNERALYFDLYRRVNSVNDWKKIKQSPSENYQLTTDLDFMYATDFAVGNFSGKINGNNYTIKNIEITTGNGLFTTLTGELKNLYVINYKKTNASSYGGLIYNSSNVSTIDNVHMTNVYINATNFLGGIIGYGSGTIIRNSSVTNFKNINAEGLIDVRIGALAGYLSGGYVQNSFVQNTDIDITNSVSTYGIGGMVGQMDGGLVENCYAVGSIKTNSSTTGGIVGLSSASISNVYTNVNIESSLDYIGGIVGQATNNYLYNSLVIGNLYSSYITTNLHRTVGNLAPNQNNYALDTQLINGFESDSFYGEVLISYPELLVKSNYDTVVKLGEYYDYSNIGSGYLPKLYNTDGTTLLPNQVNNALPQQQFAIISVDTVKRMNDATILLSFSNPNNLEITGLGFDYFNVVNTNKILTQDGITNIEVVVEPRKCLDTYKLNKIIYKENGTTKEFNKSVKLNLQFYKNIGSFEDWQSIDSTVPENYRLIADLDFQGKVNVNMNVMMARLEGIDSGHTIKNLIINKNLVSQSLIKMITTNLSNVKFDNITISNNRTSGNYNNIIMFSYANISNINFTNITIDAPKMSYSAPIGINRGYFVSNININTVNVKGANYTAGFIAYAFSGGYNDITASNLTITGQSYTGGVIGYKPYLDVSTYYTFNVTNANVTGTTYVGGIFGIGSADNSNISGSTVTGTSYVGGFAGQSYFLYTRNITVNNCNVSGTTTYIGGIFGQGQYYLYNNYIFNSTVTGTLASTTYVGGMMGHSGGYAMYDSGILNTTVTSNGNYVGGIAGYQNDKSIYYSYVYNTTVTGLNGVGGVTGFVQTGNVANVNVNASVTANQSNAGSVYGYVANAITTNASYPIRIYYTMVTGGSVTAPTNVGGLIGYSESPLYTGHFYNNIVATTLNTTVDTGNISAVVGSNKDYSSLINNLLVYNNMKINNLAVSTIANNGLATTNYVTLANLKLQATYTGKSFTTSRYDFTSLATNKFPLLKASTGVVVPNQVAIDLPTEVVLTSLKLSSFEVHELPTYDVYSIGVDKINLEFNKIDSFTNFTIKVNNQIIGPYKVDNRTYTFNYDYNTSFDIILSDGINTAAKTIKPQDLSKLVSVCNDHYYYYYDKEIKTNGDSIKGEYVNLYLDKGITNDGDIYDLSTKELISQTKGITLMTDNLPLYTFSYNDHIINTYYRYSEITDKNRVTTIHDDQYIIKNGKLEIIDSNLLSLKDSIIIDSYGGSNYQSVLGTNGILYNLKTPIKVPNDFINSNIKYFTNNILDNTGFVLVYYNDGSIYGFDYRTGNKLFSEKVKSNLSLLEYFKQKITSTPDVIDSNTYNEYQEAKTWAEKLISNPIAQVLSSKEDKTIASKTTNYIYKYNPIKAEFDIYDESELLKNDNEETVTENNKIRSDIKLIEFYTGKNYSVNSSEVNGLVVFIVVICAIVISLLIYFKYVKLFRKAI